MIKQGSILSGSVESFSLRFSLLLEPVHYRKNLNNWTVCYVVGLSSPSMVKKFFFFFLPQRGERGRVFAVFFAPFSREGNSGLHSTPSNFSSFYGIGLGRGRVDSRLFFFFLLNPRFICN